jgi:hypothetical protein
MASPPGFFRSEVAGSRPKDLGTLEPPEPLCGRVPGSRNTCMPPGSHPTDEFTNGSTTRMDPFARAADTRKARLHGPNNPVRLERSPAPLWDAGPSRRRSSTPGHRAVHPLHRERPRTVAVDRLDPAVAGGRGSTGALHDDTRSTPDLHELVPGPAGVVLVDVRPGPAAASRDVVAVAEERWGARTSDRSTHRSTTTQPRSQS